ncbi:MAG: hypothetical protein AAGI89_14605 [Pseudomonadota bacterium]
MNPVLIGILLALCAGIGTATYKAPRLTSVLFWSLTATIFSSAALLLVIPGPFSEVAIWMSLAVPLIWAGFQFLCYWERKEWRVTASLIAVTIVGAVLVAIVEPPV